MRRLFVGDLQDEFGEISFRNLDARGFEVMIQVDLFGGHALAFDYQADLAFPANAGDVS